MKRAHLIQLNACVVALQICKLRQRIGNFLDALCDVVDFYDAKPQRSVVASPIRFYTLLFSYPRYLKLLIIHSQLFPKEEFIFC